MQLTPYSSLRVRLYDMKREWLLYIDEAEARGDLEEARAFQTQLEQIYSMLESIGCDPTEDQPHRIDAFATALLRFDKVV